MTDAPKTKPNVRLGMHASLWGPSWTREVAEIAVPEAAKYGLQVIEVPLMDPDPVDAAHSRALFEEYGITPTASLCLPFEVTAPHHPEKAEAFLMNALEKAHALGCDFFGGVTFSTLGWKSGSPPTETEYQNILKALKPVAARAADYGIRFGIEACNRYETHLINTAAQTVWFMDRLGAPNATAHLDTYHMNIEEKGIGHGLRVAGDRCNYLHISESDRGVPGTGTIDWNDVFRALAETDFKGDLVIESFVTLPPDIAAALCVWRSVARDRYEILEKGVAYIQSLARVHGLI
ncbi:sugar phosphate isomerase/epimerase family protein [Segnochrobactrum spirostomi]|uniref:TIM barrel protein n=1 Tax=Segnochrobactrum spirostomi TaxID=2608987 RepID=A0A6A7Y2W6_9HYPH|nr:sugar phosphate isomerase/epimerase [Segnochrobactrum spirostomi]MQT13440.1 TIM barrel protein [Segnochrobactrum spirostomi]